MADGDPGFERSPTGGDAAEVAVVIPARGGSKGIPGKNLAVVGGRSLIRRAVETARAARRVDLVVVSTDDASIAAEARLAGAHVIDRPAELSGDAASSESAVMHALDHLDAQPAVVVLVQATSPFLWPEDVDQLVELVQAGDADAAFTATETHGFLWRQGPDGAVGVNHGVVPRQRRQDLEPQFLETGGAYAMRTDGFRTSGHRFFGRIEMSVVPTERAMEIDEPADLELARDLAPRHDHRWLAARLPRPVGAIVFDFDGVMTDNLVMTDQDGRESVAASRSDGMGVEHLRRAGIPMMVLSKEQNPVTTARCAKLQLEVKQGIDRKDAELQSWLAERSIDPATVIYVGNDVNDLDCMAMVGCGAAVADAHPEVLRAATVVLPATGGRGAVRALADAIALQ